MKQIPGRTAVHCYWFAPLGSFSLLSYTSQDILPRGSTIHSGLDPPASVINNKENAPQIYMPTGQCDGGVFSVEDSFPR